MWVYIFMIIFRLCGLKKDKKHNSPSLQFYSRVGKLSEYTYRYIAINEEYRGQVHVFQLFNLTSETHILYRIITPKVKYFSLNLF